MLDVLQKPGFQVAALAVLAFVFLLAVVAITIAKFYRRCGADEALVRTGAGGNKVVIGGGITVYPILHQLLRVSLRSNKLSVERSDKNALVTKDKIKANVTTELYVKVEPLADDVLAAARSFGDRSLDAHAIGVLIEGKLTDALRSVAANQTFMDLHSQRKQFAAHIQSALAEELKKNGLTLENVSITSFSMVPVTELDARDVFDAEGLRAITESVQSNAEKTNLIQREKEIAIRLQNVGAKKQALALEQDQAQAEADQARRVAEYSAMQRAETAKVVYQQEQVAELAAYEKQKATETARIAAEKTQQAAELAKLREIEAQTIEKDKVVQAAEIDRQKALEAATIEKQRVVEASLVDKEKTVETARIAKQIAIVQSQEQAARAEAQKAEAMADEEAAKQRIALVEETAIAERARAIAIIKAQEEAEKSRIGAERDAYRTKLDAEARAEAARLAADGEASAVITLAAATKQRGEAEAEAKRKLVEADNAVATKLLLRDVLVKTLDVMPEVARELMTPAHAIKEIKVLQLQGAAGAVGKDGAAASGALGVSSPILKTILEAGAAYPLLREMMQFSQVDGGALADKARALLGHLPAELKSVVASDPELSAKVAELTEIKDEDIDGASAASPQRGLHQSEVRPAAE
jgi:uncharacterized membrane protein YqiK